MHDRVPGKPGQYKAVIAASEFAKLHSGQSAVITLTRDDQPTSEGTPYNKAAVLPDEVAALICPEVADPTLADALAALLPLIGGTMRGVLGMGGNRITGLGDPTADSDAVPKGYNKLFRAYSFSDSAKLDLLKNNWDNISDGTFLIYGYVSGSVYSYFGEKNGNYGAALCFNYSSSSMMLYRNQNGTWSETEK